MGSQKHLGNVWKDLVCPPPENEGSQQMLMLRGVGPGDVKAPEHAEAAAGTVLPYTRGGGPE